MAMKSGNESRSGCIAAIGDVCGFHTWDGNMLES
jgi:hypothetical protein